MKRLLYLTFYFEPDLCAGAFRNTPLVFKLAKKFQGQIDVFTTQPNRYSSFETNAPQFEKINNVTIHRIQIPAHKNGFLDQIKSFKKYYFEVKKLTSETNYDLVFGSSSRLFTAYLSYVIAKKKNIPLYLDIRDIFVDTLNDVLKNNKFKTILLPVLKKIEKKTFSYAKHINLISRGFSSYFNQYPQASYTYFSNGIDDEFLSMPLTSTSPSNIKTILYAGNIGDGQGLDKIIPNAAAKLGARYQFVIFGDGGAKKKLIDSIEKLNLKNVKLHGPVKRADLTKAYLSADFLFLHLNDYDAFKKVLPSKIFELASFDKPIIAGVGGYANRFIRENVDNVILFSPGDFDYMVSQLKTFQYKTMVRNSFIEKYKRTNIDNMMADSIFQYLQ